MTCPGVWLCQNEQIELSITLLGLVYRSNKLDPKFPLSFHETFLFEGCFMNVENIALNLEKALGRYIHK